MLSTSLTGPSPPQINRPLDFCSRHIMSAAFHPEPPGILFSAHVDPPLVGGCLPNQGPGASLPLGQEHECRALGRGAGGLGGYFFHPALALKDHRGLQRLGVPGGLLGCLQPRRGSVVEDFLPSSTVAHRLGDRLGPPRHLLVSRPLPGHPKEGLPFRFPLGQDPPAQERSWECVWCGW